MQAPRQSHQVVQSTLETIVSLDGCQFTVVSLQSSVVKTTGVEGSGGVLCAQPQLRLFSVTLANGVQFAGADCGRPGVSEDDFHAWCLF